MTFNRKNHWENVYQTKTPNQVSWTQLVPKTSLNFINSSNINKNAKIIDIGGGDSTLVDVLIKAGYTNITVLDISETAIERAKIRLGKAAKNVTWIVSDILEFKPTTSYDVWHDRAVFHFLTSPIEIEKYIQLVKNTVLGFVVMGTFSKQGPKKCSGLDIMQYNDLELKTLFTDWYQNVNCVYEDHITPFNTVQNFIFCCFKRVV